jgi:uncharacterized membrane protein YjjP (DUF1212 family)
VKLYVTAFALGFWCEPLGHFVGLGPGLSVAAAIVILLLVIGHGLVEAVRDAADAERRAERYTDTLGSR